MAPGDAVSGGADVPGDAEVSGVVDVPGVVEVPGDADVPGVVEVPGDVVADPPLQATRDAVITMTINNAIAFFTFSLPLIIDLLAAKKRLMKVTNISISQHIITEYL